MYKNTTVLLLSTPMIAEDINDLSACKNARARHEKRPPVKRHDVRRQVTCKTYLEGGKRIMQSVT